MSSLLIAFLAGALTCLNPCVLPMLPFVIASAFGSGRFGPLALVAGMTVVFATAGSAIAALGPALGIDDQAVRIAGAIVMIVFGLVMLAPRGQLAFATAAGPVASGASGLIDRLAPGGAWRQFATGALLALVWTPCSGPTLAAAVGLAAQGGSLAQAALTMLVFALGAGAVMLAFAYGARGLLVRHKAAFTRWSAAAKPVFGVLFVLLGLFVVTGFDKVAEARLVDIVPDWLAELTTRF
jgi:cytochrome c-type biogenesis protein